MVSVLTPQCNICLTPFPGLPPRRSQYCLVRECRELEEAYGTNYTDRISIAEEGECLHRRVVREDIVTRDRAMTLAKCSQNGKALIVAEVAILVGRSFETTLRLPVLQLTLQASFTLRLPVLQLTLQASFTLRLPVLQLTLQGSFTLGYIGTSEREHCQVHTTL